MKINKLHVLLLAFLLNSYQESRPANNNSLVIGGAVAAAAVVAGLYGAYKLIVSGGKNPPPVEFESLDAFQAKLQSIVDEQGSVWDDAVTASNDMYNYHNPTSPILSQYANKDAYLNAQVDEYLGSTADAIYGYQVGKDTGFDSFVGKWMTGLPSGATYIDGIEAIANAMSTGKGSGLGAYGLPEGSSSLLDYMIKNNITSTSAVRQAIAKSQANDDVLVDASSSGPSTGPGTSPSSGPGTGGAGDITSSTAYKYAMEMYNYLKATMTVEAYSSELVSLNKIANQNLSVVQAKIKALPEGSSDIAELQAEEAKYQAEVQASNDAYKAVNDADIPVE